MFNFKQLRQVFWFDGRLSAWAPARESAKEKNNSNINVYFLFSFVARYLFIIEKGTWWPNQ
ncbi:hypothetical protein ACFSR6_00630 [Pedobacter vanadiisoli]|uniref:Uncharacterized protein n=1 Tax=Pedobacter vanadiisoli TaxID=1761975 RepID=A0ABW5MDS1_9SPHI